MYACKSCTITERFPTARLTPWAHHEPRCFHPVHPAVVLAEKEEHTLDCKYLHHILTAPWPFNHSRAKDLCNSAINILYDMYNQKEKRRNHQSSKNTGSKWVAYGGTMWKALGFHSCTASSPSAAPPWFSRSNSSITACKARGTWNGSSCHFIGLKTLHRLAQSYAHYTQTCTLVHRKSLSEVFLFKLIRKQAAVCLPTGVQAFHFAIVGILGSTPWWYPLCFPFEN